jgi:hypothetical protein
VTVGIFLHGEEEALDLGCLKFTSPYMRHITPATPPEGFPRTLTLTEKEFFSVRISTARFRPAWGSDLTFWEQSIQKLLAFRLKFSKGERLKNNNRKGQRQRPREERKKERKRNGANAW